MLTINDNSINIYTCSQADLESLRNVGPKTASKIISLRNEVKTGQHQPLTVHDLADIRLTQEYWQSLIDVNFLSITFLKPEAVDPYQTGTTVHIIPPLGLSVSPAFGQFPLQEQNFPQPVQQQIQESYQPQPLPPQVQELPYKFYVLGQIGLSKQCRPRSDCSLIRICSVCHSISIFWMHLCNVTSNFSIFRTIMAIV